MKKFTKVLEDIDNSRYYEVSGDIKLLIMASNEGEAGYMSDSILGSVENQVDFSIALIEEIPKEEYQKYFDSYGYSGEIDNDNYSDEEKVLKNWDAEFGDETPSPSEKMEFYHRMRKAGIEGDLIMKILKNKLLGN